MMSKPVKIVQVNPMHTKRMKEVNDNSPLKTDDKDPRVIADIIRLGHALTVVVPEGGGSLSEKTQQCAGTTHRGTHFLIQPAPATGLPNLPLI